MFGSWSFATPPPTSASASWKCSITRTAGWRRSRRSTRLERCIGDIVRCLRVHRPQVVVCFGPEGAYGHPDHKVVSRLTVQACTLSGDPEAYELDALAAGLSPWSPSKLYFQSATSPTVDSLKLPAQPPHPT